MRRHGTRHKVTLSLPQIPLRHMTNQTNHEASEFQMNEYLRLRGNQFEHVDRDFQERLKAVAEFSGAFDSRTRAASQRKDSQIEKLNGHGRLRNSYQQLTPMGGDLIRKYLL